jgi:hypothetical protein
VLLPSDTYRKPVTFIRAVLLTSVTYLPTVKNAVFWDLAPCSSCVNRRFGGTYRLHLQGKKIRERGTNVSRWLQTVYRLCLVYRETQDKMER